MARYVVLSFQDNEASDKFVELMDSQEFSIETYLIAASCSEVAAVFGKPTLFCECGADYTAKAFKKSGRYGWYVHLKCKKPTENWGSKIKYILGQARDLLPDMREARDSDKGNQE